MSPLNPGGPLWVGNISGKVSPETIKTLFNILTVLISSAVAVGAKIIASNFIKKIHKLVKGKLEIDAKEFSSIQSQIKSIYNMLDKTKNPETKAKYEAMLKDANQALEEIKARLEMKAKGIVA